MYCHTLDKSEIVNSEMLEWRTDFHKELPPDFAKPWILSLRTRIDPAPYLAKKPTYVQVEIDDLDFYRDRLGDYPLILGRHLDELKSLEPIDELMRYPADLYKIAAYISSPELLMQFMRRVSEEPRLIGIALGTEGEVTRALSRKLNNPITFVGNAAPGQLPAEILEERFRLSSQTSATRAVALLGHPLTLSPGTRFHNAYFAAENLDWRYVNIPLKSGLDAFLKEVPDYFIGFSVTTPLKKAAARYARCEEPAINTLKRTEKGWEGINTDGPAARLCLEKRGPLKGKRIAILGMGSTGEAIACAVAPADVTFYNRTPRPGSELLADFNPESFDIIIQATSAGMEENVLPTAAIPRNKLVLELILRETPFQQACLRAGCEVITGMELFKEQAKLQQIFWRS